MARVKKRKGQNLPQNQNTNLPNPVVSIHSVAKGKPKSKTKSKIKEKSKIGIILNARSMTQVQPRNIKIEPASGLKQSKPRPWEIIPNRRKLRPRKKIDYTNKKSKVEEVKIHKKKDKMEKVPKNYKSRSKSKSNRKMKRYGKEKNKIRTTYLSNNNNENAVLVHFSNTSFKDSEKKHSISDLGLPEPSKTLLPQTSPPKSSSGSLLNKRSDSCDSRSLEDQTKTNSSVPVESGSSQESQSVLVPARPGTMSATKIQNMDISINSNCSLSPIKSHTPSIKIEDDDSSYDRNKEFLGWDNNNSHMQEYSSCMSKPLKFCTDDDIAFLLARYNDDENTNNPFDNHPLWINYLLRHLSFDKKSQ
ncbi:unnamed protein product [Moneuplotes crassus]|uniref:Uncharacterized protein n=1 Tax=Euplotes crassus TaxID=5936 RepID=A0AAD1X9V1_EUPCR|nr:unnamed protein product [Moneuplotes crassus]